MILVAGLLLLAACLVDKIGDKPVNRFYLGLGVVFVIVSTGILIFKKK